MQYDNKTTRSVADAVALIMAGTKPEEKPEQLQEGWDDMLKSVKDKNGPQPNGGSGVKQGSRYGGGKQKDEPEAEEKPKAKKVKGKFTEMVNAFQENGLKSFEEALGKKKKVMKEEPDNEQFTKELERQKRKNAGTATEEEKAKVAAPASQGCVEVKEETEVVEEELTGGQKKLDKNKNNKIDSEDFKILRKEEAEELDERHLTAAETEKKEDIVKSMKKSISGFKARYGDRAKSVMYATATKQAKGE